MTNSEMTLLFNHVYWMRDRILRAADSVPEVLVEQRPPRSATFGPPSSTNSMWNGVGANVSAAFRSRPGVRMAS